MKRKPLLLLFLLFEASVIFYGNSTLGLFESSEARYAEVAREMLETGDFISPQMDYVHHFTKPPLAYWITSLGMWIFGVNAFGARFFVALFALLTMLAAFFLAEESGEDGLLAAIFLGASPLFFVMSKVLTTDMYLTFFVTAGVLLHRLRENGKLDSLKFDVLFGACAALALLTKGQVALLYWAMIFGGRAAFSRSASHLKPFASPLLWLVAVAGSGWWFLTVGLKHPGLLEYLFLKEAVEASYSAQRFHPGPFYYYLPVILGGLFPFWVLFFSGKDKAVDGGSRRLYGYTVVPLLLFSLFPAKLPTYLLPSFPGWALLLSRATDKGRRIPAGLPAALLAVQALLALAVLALSPSFIGARAYDVAAILAGGCALSACSLLLASKGRTLAACAAVFLSVLFSSLWVPHAISKDQERFKIAREAAIAIKNNIVPGEEVLELRTTVYSIPFYLERKVHAYENNFFRKKFLGDRPPHILQTEEELDTFVNGAPGLWIVVDRNAERFLRDKYPSFVPFREGSRYLVYVSPETARRLRM